MPSNPTLQEDLQAIEALNRHDVEAVLSGDPAALIPQWTEDLVVLPSSGAILRGRAAYAAVLEQTRDTMQAIEPVDTVADSDQVTQLADTAYQPAANPVTM